MNLQRAGGIAALMEALIYVTLFVFYGALLEMPAGGSDAEKFAALGRQQDALTLVNLLGFVVFGALLAVLVTALHERLKQGAPVLSQLAALFGVVWVGMVMASGMIVNSGLAAAIRLAVAEPAQGLALWRSVSTVAEGIGGGNEIVGGLWVLLVSVAAFRSNALPRALNWLGLVVGGAGILTVYPAEILTEIFGVTQIVWFAWLGFAMLRPIRSA
jgi:hypothetical protein